MSSAKYGVDNTVINKLILAVLIHKLGGKVAITQAYINTVAYSTLQEDGLPDGTILLELQQRKQQ